jgi:diaminopimelate epimerase
MTTTPFLKINALGNDFIAFDNRDESLSQLSVDQIQRLCDRRRGVGADGLLLLCESEQAAWRMRIFNPDGTEAPMCGNGSRAMALFAEQLGLSGSASLFEAGDGLHQVYFHDDGIELQLQPPRQLQEMEPEFAGAENFRRRLSPLSHLGFINTGVPHYVAISTDLDTLEIDSAGAWISRHELFGSGGTNVNFAQLIDRQTLRTRTWEKGVDAETLSCGTGGTAAVILLHQRGLLDSPVVVQQPGGELTVSFSDDYQQISFRGKIKAAFQGEWQF